MKSVLALTSAALLGGLATIVFLQLVPKARSSQLEVRTEQADVTPARLSAAFNRAARIVEPAVVHLTTLDVDEIGDAYGQTSGSGVIIDPEGYILTNYHVVGLANKIKVRLSDGTLLSGEIVGVDEEIDLAVVKVNHQRQLPVAKVGDSEKVIVGEWVLAIGSPFGLQQTVTAGIISAKERITDSNRSFQQMLQTDASINPGNSGGPLVNMAGEVIGINTQIATKTGGFQGIGFAIPSAIFMDAYHQIVTTGRVARGYLGIYPDKISPQFREVYELGDIEGALVHDVTETDGPAAQAGLKSGDVIVEFNGQKIRDDRDLIRRVTLSRPNTDIPVKYMRDGKLYSCTIKLAEREIPQTSARMRLPPVDTILGRRPRLERSPNPKESSEATAERINDKLGISIAPLSPLRARSLGYTTTAGVIIRSVQNNSIAHDAGLRDGDLILQVNRKAINSQEDYFAAVKQLKPGDSVVFFVEQRSRGVVTKRFRSLTIPL
ncbi:MAG: trypsin-like peptidase domain-containing protein [Acidobacteriota bacterium]|nr:trypsin-like peptidase domain-containing protein [Blastocatellia bacterium]MDW8412048.1 trypsin-like peptidase domain-containing protein [Acidobacteriota bacterium]